MIRLHIPGIPYTITRGEYSHDAYTGKVLRFAPMMRSLGYEVYHYGIETSESGATKHIDLMTKEEWTDLRIKSWQFVDKSLTYEEAVKRNSDPTQVISQLSNWSSPLSKEFNIRFRKHLIENYRSKSTDIVCNPLARTYESAIDKLNYVSVETGIGYSGSYLNYRIFESYAWLSSTLGKEGKMPSNYWFVVPNYFDTSEFKLSLTPLKKRIGFLGRINDLKGCRIIMEIARRFPDIEFILCGQGDPKVYLDVPNIKYKEPIHGSERSDYLGSCMAVLCLSKYLEPFCGVAVEAQLCGTPVISTDWGAMVETIEQGVTGLRGHTLSDYCYGVQMALDSKFDRQYIRDRAVRLYDMYNVAKQYDYTFRTILDMYTPGKNGWYSPDTHIKRIYEPQPEEKLQDIVELKQKKNYNINEVIPRKIWQTWNTHELPPKMKECIDTLKNNHPDFEYRLFDKEERRKFIKDNFPEEIVLAYDALIPGAYKADLWRYCVLYIHGGIYLDVKRKFVDGFTLDLLLDKEYYVRDGKFKKNNIEYASIYNGMIICKKGNPSFLNAIVNIVYNVSTKFMGMNPWQPTGPFLLGNNLDIEYNNIDFTFGSFNGSEKISYITGKLISTNYPEYRDEQKSTSEQEYYIDLWNKKSIYNDCNIDLLKIYNEKLWPKEFHNLLKKKIYEGQAEEKIQPVIKVKQKRIYTFIPYYGGFPNYFQLYLDSLGINTDILTVFLITDIDMTGYKCPTNLIVIKMPKSDIQKRLSKFILDTYEKVVEPENLIKDNYKFVDIKIVLPLLFDDLLKKYTVTEDDFVGWGDIDLIYGKLSNFIDFNKGYGILGGWHGHFAAIQNTDSFKNNFKTIPNFLELITDNSKTFITDEIAYREPLKAYLSKYNIKMFYTNAHFCDIVPPCFFHKSRPDYKTFEKNFYDLYNPYKNIKAVVYDKSKLMVEYDDGTSRETLYCHLQKRKMDLPFTSYDTYYINESGFSVIPQNIWQTWETKDLSPKMSECVDKLKKNNPTFTYYLFDEVDRRKFIKDNFPEEVVLAYDALIPGAYRADLWRYCVLYIHGGTYIDIKMQFEEGSLKDYINKENFVSDSTIIKETCDSICNGFIVSKKNNPILLKSIVNIVYNVSKEYYGENPWAVTGPRLVGKHYKESEYKPDIDLIHYGPVSNETIKKGEKIILTFYPEYRKEQLSNGPHYKELWKTRGIYNKSTINLLDVYEKKTWPEAMLKELTRYMV